jgi:hypothetical protein
VYRNGVILLLLRRIDGASVPKHSRVELYIDPPTHHFLRDRLFDSAFAAYLGDQVLAPYSYLKKFFEARGIAVHTADFLDSGREGALKVYVSLGRWSQYRRLAGRPDVILSAFLAIESPAVEPALYRELKHAQHLFRRVYSWSDSASLEPFAGGPLRVLPMRVPQSFESVHEEIWPRSSRKFLVMMNANKVPRYQTPCRELYGERMKAVEYFARTGDIDLYGRGWDGPTIRVGQWCVPGTFGKLPMPGTLQQIHRGFVKAWQGIFPEPRLVAARRAYRGSVASKSGTLGNYKFALCFENSILKGYVTEKLFDSFFAGAIPVYWGAPDIEQHVPQDCFIDMRRFEDYGALKEYLKSLEESDIRRYKENARAFLTSPRFRPFTKQAFTEIFARIIEEDAGVTWGDPAATVA